MGLRGTESPFRLEEEGFKGPLRLSVRRVSGIGSLRPVVVLDGDSSRRQDSRHPRLRYSGFVSDLPRSHRIFRSPGTWVCQARRVDVSTVVRGHTTHPDHQLL